MELELILLYAGYLLEAIQNKSWHHACNAADACVRHMPSPAWMEREPGMAIYGPGEKELNVALNALRYTILTWMRAFVHPTASWEASDAWPEPNGLRMAIEKLRGFLVVPGKEEAPCLTAQD